MNSNLRYVATGDPAAEFHGILYMVIKRNTGKDVIYTTLFTVSVKFQTTRYLVFVGEYMKC